MSEGNIQGRSEREEAIVKLVTLNAPLGTPPSLYIVKLVTQNKLFNKGRLSKTFHTPNSFIPKLQESQNKLAFEVDCILSDLECSKSKIEDINAVIVFYSINGDDVEYFPQNSFHAKVDFIFPLDSFLPLKQPMIKETLMIHATLVANCLERLFIVSTWANICLIAYYFACSCRRRTIGPLAQTFDTRD